MIQYNHFDKVELVEELVGDDSESKRFYVHAGAEGIRTLSCNSSRLLYHLDLLKPCEAFQQLVFAFLCLNLCALPFSWHSACGTLWGSLGDGTECYTQLPG
jgi:hypothetical protein